jgi:hypothetical protein
MAVSFQSDIKPLFTTRDVQHMANRGVLLDNYEYMSKSENAQNVYDYLTGAKKPQMPLGGPFWSQTQLDLFNQWMQDGYQP